MKSTRQWHTTIPEALADGWIKPYEGGRSIDGWKGRIYGQRPGNHRAWRCYWRGDLKIKTRGASITRDFL